jgi:hypothetical protein
VLYRFIVQGGKRATPRDHPEYLNPSAPLTLLEGASALMGSQTGPEEFLVLGRHVGSSRLSESGPGVMSADETGEENKLKA